ncbi:MAG: amino acid ABC transporter permease [Rubrivivax sp.]|uniref:amino acid ABC transporter permease n=1 Tax=Ottowia sp. TaxID=1898956 RepID=UPI002178A222|nr:amino acid ABC transporter permease [Ottowia sp.]MCC6813677.1 amino acid ABC transporter permease [Rubrivivax sp.]HNK53048.1 amino acid ABC transporter permease [Ottowia sp.]HNL42039.1 amino acid ABC transporter permease [Ottowia sp.]HNN33441.1 amino acid ABC transporter permease [Ottowia sp.]HNR82804.1 amino acid ABC transporter permease [Ottowia sp.]
MAMDWSVFCKDTLTGEVMPGCFGSGQDITYLNWLFTAWGWTVAVSLTALVVAMVMGSIVGVIRTLPDRPGLVRLGNAWVELFRNIPLLVQIFLWYFVVPALVPPMKDFPPFVLVVLALGLFTSARIAEQVRAGIQALPKGQRFAGMALGLTTPQYYRYVLLPMAYRIIIPPLTSESMNIFKNSAVAFAVSIPELTQYALQVGEETARPIEVYIAVTILYAVSALIINRIFAWIEKRARVPGFVAAGTGAGGH